MRILLAVGPALWLRAITSGQTKAPEPTTTLSGFLVGSGVLRSGLLQYSGRTLPAKTKTPDPTTALSGHLSWAPALYALASLDMQDDLRFAIPAKNRQAIRLGLRGDPQQSLVSPTHWAGDPSVLRDQCITFGFYLQPIFASVSVLCLKKSQHTSVKLSCRSIFKDHILN